MSGSQAQTTTQYNFGVVRAFSVMTVIWGIVGMLVGAAFALYPVVLPGRDPQYSLTIENTAAGAHGLSVGLVWWTFGAVLAVAYFVFIYRMFRGKVVLGEGHY